MRTPTVQSGLRGASDPLKRKDRSQAIPVATHKQKDPNAFVFRSKASNYVFIITNPQNTFNPVTGKMDLSAPIKKAKFQNYVLETADMEIVEKLLGSNQFGLGRDFWLLEEEQKIQTIEAAKGLLGQLHSLPNVAGIPAELRQKLARALGLETQPSFDPAAASQA